MSLSSFTSLGYVATETSGKIPPTSIAEMNLASQTLLYYNNTSNTSYLATGSSATDDSGFYLTTAGNYGAIDLGNVQSGLSNTAITNIRNKTIMFTMSASLSDVANNGIFVGHFRFGCNSLGTGGYAHRASGGNLNTSASWTTTTSPSWTGQFPTILFSSTTTRESYFIIISIDVDGSIKIASQKSTATNFAGNRSYAISENPLVASTNNNFIGFNASSRLMRWSDIRVYDGALL